MPFPHEQLCPCGFLNHVAGLYQAGSVEGKPDATVICGKCGQRFQAQQQCHWVEAEQEERGA